MSDHESDKAIIVAMVAPWLPGASVEEFDLEEECGCYSEWTQESPHLYVTLKAPRPAGESEIALSKIVTIVEKVVERWARTYDWRGCSCCDGVPSIWARVIPEGAVDA